MERRIVPFYMAYPLPVNYQDEQEMVRDMEYLQSQHSMEIRQLRKHIADTINIMDYEGSMIYDEYPDRYGIARLAKTMVSVLRKEEDEAQPEAVSAPEKWEWVENMIQVLLCNEIYKRRHGGRRGFLNF